MVNGEIVLLQAIEWWELLVQIATILVAFFGGGKAAVPLVNGLKNLLGASGNAALLITVIVSVVLGIATLVVEGLITPDAFTIGNLSALVIAVYAASQKFYEELKGS